MNILRCCLSMLALTFALNTHATDLLIVANTTMDDVQLDKRQVRDIFMGNNSSFTLKPAALVPNSESRFIFNTKIVGLTESRIQSY